MTEAEATQIIKEVKKISNKITEHTEKAQLDALLSYYAEDPDFLAFGSDGKMRNYEGFKKTCTEYYGSLQEQKVMTIEERFHVIDKNLVILGWMGNIEAHFRNGDIMKMNDYSVSNVFLKTDAQWKIIHSHESGLPPEIIKKEQMPGQTGASK